MPEHAVISPPPEAVTRPVQNAGDLRAFIDLPWTIYASSPHWVPPLKAEVEEILTNKNPFWQHAERELFLAERDGTVVGRCAAIVDRAFNEFHEERTGFFGFFECVDDEAVAAALLEAARRWLTAKGMDVMRGPASPSFNEECGLLINAFDEPPYVMVAYNPPYYARLLESAGLKKAKDLYSYYLHSDMPVPKRIAKLAERIERKKGVRLRTLTKSSWERDLQSVRDIYNSAWEKNWGFSPMTPPELDQMVVKLKPILHLDAVHFIEVDGKVVAFSLLLPDVNQVLRRLNGKLGFWGTLKFLYYFRKINRTRLLTLGVRKEFRDRGFEILLYREAFRTAKRKGWGDSELDWILEDNERMNRGMKALESRHYKTHRVFETALR